MKSSDEKIPFTCCITKEYCGEDINFICLSIHTKDNSFDNKKIAFIPVSDKIINKINRKKINNIVDLIKKELQN